MLLFMAFASAALGDEAAARVGLSCATSLELPTHGIMAAKAGTSGVVTAKIHIGEAGQVSDLQLSSDNRYLEGEVRVAIDLSKFAARCKRRVLELIFSFTLQDPPTDSIVPPAVRFLPPNRFELIFRRVKPNHESPAPKAK